MANSNPCRELILYRPPGMASQRSPFLELPAEVRNMIYGFAIDNAVAHLPSRINLGEPLQQPAITLVNHQVQAEAMSIFYSSQTFTLRRDCYYRPIHADNLRWIARLEPTIPMALRSISIVFDMNIDIEDPNQGIPATTSSKPCYEEFILSFRVTISPTGLHFMFPTLTHCMDEVHEGVWAKMQAIVQQITEDVPAVVKEVLAKSPTGLVGIKQLDEIRAWLWQQECVERLADRVFDWD